ncbi:MAG: exo-alpha-sialidase [Candidatus Hydrogenedentes bacterium]|nr:exo-alpha-sialidase [Candidatus Hydrogenedentota bacterium]
MKYQNADNLYEIAYYKGNARKTQPVSRKAPNQLRIYDMLGNVAEWCEDWYGPYDASTQTDPVGRADGDFRVTRGGSHGTIPYYLRSANRAGSLPQDKSWLIGFRVAMGPRPATKALAPPPPPRHQQDVRQAIPENLAVGPDPAIPYFRAPRRYVNMPEGNDGPLYAQHNHDPALVECPNGDLLAIWYTTIAEPGRELALAAARLRYGADAWDEAAPFWDAPDRNDHGPAAWNDGKGNIHVFVGLSAAATWGNLAVVTMQSADSGATWSKARIIMPEHGIRHLPVESVFRMKDGSIVLPCDASSRGHGGTAIHLSTDNGQTWTDPGGKLAGIHGGVVQLGDGRLFGFGRGDDVPDSTGVLRMPQSISSDRGKTWTTTASIFSPISSGRRLALIRLKEGALFLASFASQPMAMTDALGKPNDCTGLFAALSYDDGVTWPAIRLISDGSGKTLERMDGQPFVMDVTSAEPNGYLSVCQTPDGVIQLLSSRQHYAFNSAWIGAQVPR